MLKIAQLVTTVILSCIASLTAGKVEAGVSAEPKYRYHYVSLDQAVLPHGFAYFSPADVVDNGKVYGTLLRSDDPDGCFPSIGVWRQGRVSVLVDGARGGLASNSGTIAGEVVRDCVGKLALFRHVGVKLIPTPPDALFTFVDQLTNPGVALIESVFFEEGFVRSTLSLYRRGRSIPIDLGPGSAFSSPHITSFGGLVAGTYIQPGSASGANDTRAFRHHTSSGTTTFLRPRATEHVTWGQGIHQNGDVLGYSWNPGSVVGVWRNRPGNPFQTWLVEGTADFPTVSNRLLWNEPGLIVVTVTGNYNSYIVPRPGVSLNLADLTAPPPPRREMDIWDINDRGDLLGAHYDPDTGEYVGSFLLRRVGGHRAAALTPTVAAARHHAPLPRNLMGALHPELFQPRTNRKIGSVTR